MAPRNDKPASKADLAAVEAGLQSNIAAVKTELKSDIAAVKTWLKSDIAAVKTELKSDIAAVKTDITRLDLKIDKVAMELVKTQGSLRTLAETMATKDDISRIMNAIDGFAGKLETYTRESVTLPKVMERPRWASTTDG